MDKIYGGSSTLADSSKRMYFSKLRKIAGTKEIPNLNFLKDVDAVTKKIEAMSENPNSRRSCYIAIVSALKDKKPYKKAYAAYHAAMMGLNSKLNKDPHKDETTKKKTRKRDDGRAARQAERANGCAARNKEEMRHGPIYAAARSRCNFAVHPASPTQEPRLQQHGRGRARTRSGSELLPPRQIHFQCL